jgi:hypothetical protein
VNNKKTYIDVWQDTQNASYPLYEEMNPNSISTANRADVQLFGEFIKTDYRDNVLDIGSGTGGYIPGYMANHKVGNYVGIDPSPPCGRQLYVRIQAWAELMPFRDDSFTVGIIGTSLDHILCFRSFWDELYRVVSNRVYIWTALVDGYYFNVPSEKLFDRENFNIDCMLYNNYLNEDVRADKHHIRFLPLNYFEADEIFLNSGFIVKQHIKGIDSSHHLVELTK